MILAAIVAASLAFVPVSSAAASSDAPILVLDDHDYVYPRLSPDGSRLLVARAIQRADGTETTDVILVDVVSGAERELISRSEEEKNETYETFVIGLRWLNDRRVEISLSDGDVGGTDLLVDVPTGTILRAHDADDGDSLVPHGFADVAADAAFYSRHFSREELERSLGSSAVRLNPMAILVQRVARRSSARPIFYIEPTKRRVKRIASMPESMELWDAIQSASEIVFLTVGEDLASVQSYRGKSAKPLATWSVPTRSQCPRIEAFSSRIFVFVRPCTRSEPSQATLWEITSGAAIHRPFDENLDEFSASADGSRIALGVWRHGRRIVQVFGGFPGRGLTSR